MWPTKPYLNMLQHRIEALLREGPHEASREEMAEVLISLAIHCLQMAEKNDICIAQKCHALVEDAVASGAKLSS